MTGKQSGTTWIVVANQELMRIYAREAKHGDLSELRRLEHPAGQRAGRELTTDRPGRTFDSAGQGRHAMEPPTDPKENEATRFAKIIANEIEDGRKHDRFSGLVLVAGPAFLGRLRQELSNATIKLVEREVDKNFSKFDVSEIQAMLSET
jgi:protein required for attachment to host cells